MADTKTSKDVLTPFGKLSFVNLYTPRAPMDGKGDPRYGTNLIIPQAQMKTPAYKALQQAIIDCAKDFFGDKVDLKRIRLPIRKSSERDYEGYDEDSVFIAPWSKQKPGVVDKQGNEILIADDVYAGQVARLSVRPFGYDNSGNKGVGLALNHVQIAIADAPRLDGRRSAADTFAKADEVDTDDLADIFGLDTPASGGAAAASSSGADQELEDLMG
jgi:hypothetical protein